VAATYHVLTKVYLASAKLADARRAFERATMIRQLALASRLGYDITTARLRMADAPADAASSLRAVIDAATSRGHLRVAYEARLYLAEAERLMNQPQAARADLQRLQRDAAAKGYGLIAHKAAAAVAFQRAARD
jgi:hypothetical protein